MNIKTGYWTIARFYDSKEPVFLEHKNLSAAQDWGVLLSEDLGTKGFVDVAAQGKLVAVWRNGMLTKFNVTKVDTQ